MGMPSEWNILPHFVARGAGHFPRTGEAVSVTVTTHLTIERTISLLIPTVHWTPWMSPRTAVSRPCVPQPRSFESHWICWTVQSWSDKFPAGRVPPVDHRPHTRGGHIDSNGEVPDHNRHILPA